MNDHRRARFLLVIATVFTATQAGAAEFFQLDVGYVGDISADGSMAVGGLGNGGGPFYWTRESGVRPIEPFLPGEDGVAYGASADGAMIVGTYFVNYDEKLHSPLDFYRPPRKEGAPALAQMRAPRLANEGNKYTKEVHQTKPQEGMLMIWSAEMIHGYEGVFNLWKGRTTISMNFLPEIIDNGKYAYKVVPLQHVVPTTINKRKELQNNQ